MKKLPVVFLLAATLLSSGCGKNYLAEKEFYKAEKLLKSLNLAEGLEPLDKAADAFRSVADLYPSTPKALESLRIISSIRLKQKKYEEARAALIDIIQSFTASPDTVSEARYKIAEIYEKEEKWDAAEKYYWELGEFSPLNGRGLYAPIKVLLNYKRINDEKGFERAYVRVLDHYEKLINEVGPIDASAPIRNYLAMAQMIKGDNQKALENWLSIPAQYPKSGVAPMSLLAAAELEWKNQEFAKSEALYTRFFSEYPGHPLAGRSAMTLGLAYHGKSDFSKSREWYQKALELFPDVNGPERSELKLLMARSYQDEVLWDEADAIYQELERDYPNTSASLQVPLMRADHYNEVGEADKSMTVLNAAIEKYAALEQGAEDPKLVSYARRFRSQALARKGSWTEIMLDIDKRMAEETTPVRKGRWLFLKGLMTQNRLQDNPKAIEIFESFISQYPGHPLENRAKSQLETLRKPA